MTRRLFIASVCMGGSLAVTSANAEITPYVGASWVNDDNFFRVADDAEAQAVLGTTDKDETIYHLLAGVDAELLLSRQKLTLNAEVDRATFDQYEELDHTGVDAGAELDWEIGRLYSGTVAYEHEKRLTRFLELQQVEKDMVTTNNFLAEGGMRLSPEWRAVAGFGLQDIQRDIRTDLDRTETSVSGELHFATALNTYVGAGVRYGTGEFDEAGSSANDYDEQQFNIVGYWEGTSKSTFSARLGFTNRDVEGADDFSGSTGRFEYLWKATEKTELNLAAWRETSTRDELANFVLTRGFSVRPVWKPSVKLSFSADMQWQSDDFRGAGNGREDDYTRTILAASYRPMDPLRLSANYLIADRDSNVDINDFEAQRITLTASLYW